MPINFRPNLDKYHPYPLRKGWGIVDVTTGELVKRSRLRLERYHTKQWAINRCKQLNAEEKK